MFHNYIVINMSSLVTEVFNSHMWCHIFSAMEVNNLNKTLLSTMLLKKLKEVG